MLYNSGNNEKHVAPLAQNTAPPGARPGILAEPGPHRSDRNRRHSSGDTHPTFGLPVPAGASGEVVDSSAFRFLTASALEAKRKLEEEEMDQEGEEGEGAADEGGDGLGGRAEGPWHRLTHRSVWTLPSRPSAASSGARRKRKVPEASSRSSRSSKFYI